MRCPACSAEVMAEAVYCHKCGARLDGTAGASIPPEATGAFSPSASREHSGGEENPGPSSGGSEQFRQAVAAQRNWGEAAEEELWSGSYSAKAMLGAWLASGLITLGLLILGFWAWKPVVWWGVLVAVLLTWLYQLVVWARRRLGVAYRLTTLRFYHETGILRHTSDLIEVIDMDDVTFDQTLLERLTGVGTIQIISSDRTHPKLLVPGIDHVREVARTMHEARHAERMRRGLHIESI